jgi:hypothetical protein
VNGLRTVFTVYLPLLKEDTDIDKSPVKEAEGKRGTETVLIAEIMKRLKDDTGVLENHGYTVIPRKTEKQRSRV